MIRVEVIHGRRVRLIRVGWSWKKLWFVDEAETFVVPTLKFIDVPYFWEYEDGERCDYDLSRRIRWAIELWQQDDEKRRAKGRVASKLSNRWRSLAKQ